MVLKFPRCLDQLCDVRAKLLEGRQFTTADFIPMPLMNSEQFDEEHHRVVFSQAMFIAPLGDGRVELFVEIGLFVVRHDDYLADKSRSAADSISA